MLTREATLTLKEASERLGVHPNTLRNWEKQGLIRLVRLPGSQHRRAPLSEVERLLTQMHGLIAAGNVRLEPPPDDADVIAEGQAMARTIQSELAALDLPRTLTETMRSLRGRSWLS
jgi:excisionase family DNA binding protein